jgi:hypothetical protein
MNDHVIFPPAQTCSAARRGRPLPHNKREGSVQEPHARASHSGYLSTFHHPSSKCHHRASLGMGNPHVERLDGALVLADRQALHGLKAGATAIWRRALSGHGGPRYNCAHISGHGGPRYIFHGREDMELAGRAT